MYKVLYGDNMTESIKDFFTKLYYDNDILALTGANCFDYNKGEIVPDEVIKALKENNIKIKLEY